MSGSRATRELQGTFTAIVTPFDKGGAVDTGKLRDLVEWQIASGITGIVPVGTTGESPTLDFPEHEKVIETTIAAARGRCLVIAGTGANSTAEALELTRHALGAGADATLQVTPYYNKPPATGLLRHFSAVADLGLPVVLYNVPGRTSREIPLDVMVKLAEHPGVIAVKEAGGSVERVSRIVRACTLSVLSGDDSLTLPMMAVGARGVISVATNVAPEPVVAMVTHALAGRFAEARALHLKYHALFTDLFLETNPVPVKAALAMMGRIEEVYRLPLCEMEPKTRALLAATLREAGLLKA
ncbi:MAG: 4-hydroxy-tetrahydrodipicolinate synthase [Lentisphaerae bacterium]|nr:4-hydroxy-tetrahydrodipicolinate synthase [Lentisphaerota bacterium]